MNKSQYYLSQCVEAASKSPMCFTLGAVMVKGGKVISSGYNHHRTHYDGGELGTHGHRKVRHRSALVRAYEPTGRRRTQPVSMHAEMHAIYNCTGMTPSFKTQVQAMERPATCEKRDKSRKLSDKRQEGQAFPAGARVPAVYTSGVHCGGWCHGAGAEA